MVRVDLEVISMWAADNRKQYDEKGLRYPIDQTAVEWALRKPVFAAGQFAEPQGEGGFCR
jgi:hypothetical protein